MLICEQIGLESVRCGGLYSLDTSKGLIMAHLFDYIGDYNRGTKGDTGSLDPLPTRNHVGVLVSGLVNSSAPSCLNSR